METFKICAHTNTQTQTVAISLTLSHLRWRNATVNAVEEKMILRRIEFSVDDVMAKCSRVYSVVLRCAVALSGAMRCGNGHTLAQEPMV